MVQLARFVRRLQQLLAEANLRRIGSHAFAWLSHQHFDCLCAICNLRIAAAADSEMLSCRLVRTLADSTQTRIQTALTFARAQIYHSC